MYRLPHPPPRLLRPGWLGLARFARSPVKIERGSCYRLYRSKKEAGALVAGALWLLACYVSRASALSIWWLLPQYLKNLKNFTFHHHSQPISFYFSSDFFLFIFLLFIFLFLHFLFKMLLKKMKFCMKNYKSSYLLGF